MNRLQLIQRVRSNTRDFSNATFREQDIIDYLNEGIYRCAQLIPELRGMEKLLANQQEVIILPEMYHHYLALYATGRCFAQDERHRQSITYMNEFEIKMQELKSDITNGDIALDVVIGSKSEYVDLSYFTKKAKLDFDEGVGGVE